MAGLKDPAYFLANRHVLTLQFPTDGVDPRIVKFSTAFLKAAHAHGIPVKVSETFRGQDRQDALFAAGRSKAKWGQSPHNFGLAVDIIHALKGWELTARQWNLLAVIGREIARRQQIKMTWGGDWKFYDPAHWELTNWKVEKDKR